MKNINWTEVEESGNGAGLPVGGYVLVITGAQDNPAGEYVEVTYDVAEGDHASHYSDTWGKNNAWAHSQRVYYKGNAQGMFKRFLKKLEDSNSDFVIGAWQQTSDERAFIGKKIGGIVQKRLYTNSDGEDKETLEVARWESADDIRSGNFKMPEPRDNRDKSASCKAPAPNQPDMYSDIPFM